MKVAYPISQLDDLLRACVTFTDDHDQQFSTGNVAGREGVNTDVASVKRMLEWVAETDKGLIENLGFGVDNITYFRLGHYSRQLMDDGGFATYVRDRTRTERLERVRSWAPMVISLIAVIVSVFSWQTPRASSRRLDDLSSQMNVLRSDGERTNDSVVSIRAALDTLSLRIAPRH